MTEQPNAEMRKRAEQLERSREWLKRYHEKRAAAKQPAEESENAQELFDR